MLFNSYEYILIFLPCVFVLYYIVLRVNIDYANILLMIFSLYFYAYWSAKYLPLLLVSGLFNFAAGSWLERTSRWRRPVLTLGVGVNLALLIAFKYTNFLVAQLDAHLGFDWTSPEIVLPIGISFFTFTQIAYLVDVSRGICGRYDIWRYILFISFFPHLLAGPILHHREMMPQFARRLSWAGYERHISFGLLIFALGLFKKVWLADSIAPYANSAFAAADQGVRLSFVAAWWGALAYTFQLYFDFSGYTDMAIGSARFFGIRLPLNFNAPYRAFSIIDFWRRWHMTLSRFLRDYLYFPLGGNRLGPTRRYVNLLVTMALGGIWHGAGYGFAIWGVLHGLYLVINHGWRALRSQIPIRDSAPERAVGLLLTFGAVVCGWVFFRAASLEGAGGMLYAMSGLGGFDSADVGTPLADALQTLRGVKLSTLFSAALDLDPLPLPAHPVLGSVSGVFWLLPLVALAMIGPTSQQIATGVVLCARSGCRRRRLAAAGATVFISLLFLLGLARLNHVTEFLYFQF